MKIRIKTLTEFMDTYGKGSRWFHENGYTYIKDVIITPQLRNIMGNIVVAERKIVYDTEYYEIWVDTTSILLTNDFISYKDYHIDSIFEELLNAL
jgi:hypothetical protein